MAEEVTDPAAGREQPPGACPSCGAENEPAATHCARCGTLRETPTSIVVTVDLRPGSLFHSRYEILGPLGRGGMGMVYKARDRTLDEVVAIKVLRPDFAQDPRMTERFKSEIKLARKVRHRNVCTIHDYGEDRGLLYISMELIEGVDLKQVLRDQGGLPPAEAYALAIEIAEGLQAVHDAGIIHRDLKTPNIMRDAQGIARLMDFGIAKRQGSDSMTATGHIVGTPEYMSPEQAQGHKVDFRSDVYALGIVVYEIFTGSVPFRGETPISTILKHLHDPPPLDGPLAGLLPPALKPVLRRALEKDPFARFASARDLADALREARSPSRRQQPIATEVLKAPTLTEGPTAGEIDGRGGASKSKRGGSRGRDSADSITSRATLPMPSPARKLQPWLLVFPAIAVAGGVLVLRRTVFNSASAPLVQVTDSSSPTSRPGALPAPPSLAAVPIPSMAPAATPIPSPTPAEPRPAAPRDPRIEPRTKVKAADPRPSPSPSAAPPSPAAVAPAPPVHAVAVPSPTPEAIGTGSLQVVAKPWGNVSVDGRAIGSTPLDRIPLPAGSHVVRVNHPAYEAWERRVSIRDGQTERVVVDFLTEGVRRQ